MDFSSRPGALLRFVPIPLLVVWAFWTAVGSALEPPPGIESGSHPVESVGLPSYGDSIEAATIPQATSATDAQGRTVGRHLLNGPVEVGFRLASGTQIALRAHYIPRRPIVRWLKSTPVQYANGAISRNGVRRWSRGLVETGFVPPGSERTPRSARLLSDSALVGGLLPSSAVGGATGSQRRMVVVKRWAAITDQRRDVLDLRLGEVKRILSGRVTDWSELGGSAQPISVYLIASQATGVAEALNLAVSDLVAEMLPLDELIDRVADTPGAFALVEPEQLRLGVLALTVNGYDPYRDPARHSPLRLVRWLEARSTSQAVERLRLLGVTVASPFDPAGMAVTGELLPVRCTNHVLAALDDYDAMFDGVRDVIRRADIAVAALELPLTDVGQPTPCVETVVFTGSPRAVPALADAGIDVVLTIGNHMLDCYGGCSGAAALADTLARLNAVGLATAGAGEDLAAARRPAVFTVQTEQGPVSFAALGYDIIAPWYAAKQDSPGTAPIDPDFIREDVRAARELANHVLVGMNWGIEYTANPTAFQREMGGVAVDAGAGFVYGNHPHWVQAVEHYEGALIAYSFGNFIFDQRWSVPTTQGMLMELGFTADRLLGYRIRPVVIRGHSSQLPWLYRPEFVDPATQGRPILARIWNAQDRLPPRDSKPE